MGVDGLLQALLVVLGGPEQFLIDFIEQCIGIINVSEYILNTQTGLSNTF